MLHGVFVRAAPVDANTPCRFLITSMPGEDVRQKDGGKLQSRNQLHWYYTSMGLD